jgi:hypothetical protein
MHPDAQLDFAEDVFVARARPGAPHLLANHGYRAAQIIDCAAGETIAHIKYPDSIETFSIGVWHPDPTGAWSLALDLDRPETALLLDHERLSASLVRVPTTMGIATGLCWFGPHLQIVTYDGLVWGLHGDEITLEPPSEGLLAWMARARERIPDFEHHNQIKTDVAAGLAFLRGPDSALVGTATIPGAEVSLVPGDPLVTDLAGFGGAVWMSFGDRVVCASHRSAEVFFRSPEDEYILSIASVRDGTTGYLAVLSSPQEGPRSRMRLFRVPV